MSFNTIVCNEQQNSYGHVCLFKYNKKCVFVLQNTMIRGIIWKGKMMGMLRYFNALLKKKNQDRTALSLRAIFALHISETGNHYICKYDS